MFYPELIQGIRETDRVLEVGPGANPHPRSDVLLEKRFQSDGEARRQRGNTEETVIKAKLVLYEGERFPFSDGEFDYVICSHVLEHVECIETFAEELFRVAKKGYVEYPTLYYEYLYNFSVHRNLLKSKNQVLYYLKKTLTPLSVFEPVQKFFYRTLERGNTQFVDSLKEIMFEGFEWRGRFEIRSAETLCDLTFDRTAIEQLLDSRRIRPESRWLRMLRSGLNRMKVNQANRRS